MYADTSTDTRVLATPKAEGVCPGCGAGVIAKCGGIVSWHWAHLSGVDCDNWSEPVSEWHLGWQRHAPALRREVVIGPHRADIVASDGSVVEVQQSSLSPAEIADREWFYGSMTWIFDARAAWDEERLYVNKKLGDGLVTFRWKQPRKSLASCRQRVLLDLGTSELLRLVRIYPDRPCYGLGWLVPVADVTSWIAATARQERRAS